MAAPKGTLWPREAHTEGKHLVLENYLKAWFPILGMGERNRRILFIDGFAGPGKYEDGAEGSPVVAMRVLAKHPAEIKAEVVFFFIERKPDRADHLKRLVAQWRPRLPATAKVHVREGSFDASMTDVLDELEARGRKMAPALVMIDPFGVKGHVDVGDPSDHGQPELRSVLELHVGGDEPVCLAAGIRAFDGRTVRVGGVA